MIIQSFFQLFKVIGLTLKNKPMRRILIYILIFYLIASCGCAQKKLSVIEIPSTTECEKVYKNDSIEICASALVEEPDLKVYYGLDLLDKGVVPFKLSVFNKGISPIVIDNSSLSLQIGEKYFKAINPNEAYDILKASVGGRTVGWGLAFGIVGGSIAYAESKRRNESLNLALHTNPFFFGKFNSKIERKGLIYFAIDKKDVKLFRPKPKSYPYMRIVLTYHFYDSKESIVCNLE